uniref:Ribosome-binding protein 1 n=1 Tax=Plectus sambesii TaxID=2011161 RepID=A0A914X6C9_9BILA
MDFSVLLVVFAIIVAILLLIGCFYHNSKETTFEQAYGANALKLLAEEKAKGKSAAQAKNKAKTLKHGKPEKRDSADVKTETVTEEKVAVKETAVSHSPVETVPTPAAASVDTNEVRQRKKSTKKTDAVEQKEQKVTQVEQPSTTTFAPLKVELPERERDSRHEKENKNAPKAKGSDVPQVADAVSVEEDGGLQGGKKKKNKAKKVDTEIITKTTVAPLRSYAHDMSATEPDVDLVIEQLKKMPISEASLSLIVECLLLRQTYAGQNTKHSEEVAKLRKQIEDKEKIMTQHVKNLTISQHAEADRIKELMQQLTTEKSKYSTLDKSARDQIQAKQNENQQLARQLQLMSEDQQHMREALRKSVENNGSPQMVEQLRGELHGAKERNNRLQADLNQHQQQLSQLHADVHNRDQQMRLLETAKRDLEARIQKMTVELNQSSTVDQALAAKDAELSSTQRELANLQSDFAALEASARNLKTDLKARHETAPAVQNGVHQNGNQNGNHEDHEHENVKNDLETARKQVARLTDELTAAMNARTEQEKATDAAQKELKQKADELTNLKKQLDSAQKNLNENQTSTERLQQQLKSLENEQTKALDGQKQLSAQQGNEQKEIKQQLETLKQQFDQTAGERDQLKQQVEKAQQELQQRLNEINTLKQQQLTEIDALKQQQLNEINTLKQEQQQHVEKVAPLQAAPDHAAASGEVNELKQQIEEQKRRNNELREKNYKAVDAVAQIEQTSKQLVKDVEKKYEKLLADQRQETATALRALVPSSVKLPDSAKVTQPEAYREWIHELTTVVKREIVQVPAASPAVSKVAESTNKTKTVNNDALESEVNKYKSILATVEEDLRSLESKAVQQEQTWERKYKDLEAELAKAKADKREATDALKNQLSDEVRQQLTTMQTKFVSEEKQCELLKEQLTILQRNLETEQKTGRDLSAQAVKLRGMLKTGQDALQHEQNVNSQLRDHIKSLQNGDITEATLEAELNELRARLSDREKQLEKETAVNKHMSDRLASLGVAVAHS